MKKETEKKEAAAGKRLILAFNKDLNDLPLGPGHPCGICGEDVFPHGFDFRLIENDTGKSFELTSYVCDKCAKKYFHSLVFVQHQAADWVLEERKRAYEEGREAGRQEGKREAGRLILEAINEPVEKRILRVCQTEILATHKPSFDWSGLEFSEKDIPS